MNNLGSVFLATGATDEARGLFERALQIYEEALGPKHPKVGAVLNNLTVLLDDAGEYEAALVLCERALAIKEDVLGPENPRVASTLINLGRLHEAMGRYDEATQAFERALAIWEGSIGLDHPRVAYGLDGLAQVALAERRFSDAAGFATRAVELRTGGDVSPEVLAESQLLLARALWPERGRRGDSVTPEQSRAIALAETARGVWAAANGKADELGMIDEWLAQRRE